MTIGKTIVSITDTLVTWTSGLEVDADGAPNAYNMQDTGIDALANAGKLDSWYGLACDAQKKPYIQDAAAPFPGYYISQTAMVDESKNLWDVNRYVDSTKVPYISIPHELLGIIHKGDLALVRYKGVVVSSIVAEVGPYKKIGEGSIALHRALGFDPFRGKPKHRLVGVESGIVFLVTRNSATTPPWPRVSLMRIV